MNHTCSNCNVIFDSEDEGNYHAESGEAQCGSCLSKVLAYWRNEFAGNHHAALKAECDPEGYRQDLIDAGRGHLVK